MHLNKFYLSIITLCVFATAHAQSIHMPPDSYTRHVLDRMEIKQGHLANPSEFNTSSGYFRRQGIAQFTDSFQVGGVVLSGRDYFNLAYIQNDNFEWTNAETTRSKRKIWRDIYAYKAAGYAVKQKDFTLAINPILHTYYANESNNNNPVTLATRGVEMRASIGHNIGIFTRIEDDVFKPFQHVNEYYRDYNVLPGEAFLKTSDKGETLKYFRARGYLTFNVNKYIDMQFGHDNNFLGNGYRSFTMSNFSKPHLFLRVNTHIWKLNYTNIYGMVHDYYTSKPYNPPRRHYYATQYLNLNATKNLSLGLFQTVSFQRDSGFADGGFDMEYLNPIIFYKAVENGLNSPDKAIIGVDFKYNFLRHFQTYGQFVIAEFVFDSLIRGSGWSGNKFAFQLGAKAIDVFGISNLDVQYEYNYARPYMYTSFSSRNAYVNYNQPMAHPLGANFKEHITILRYQPFNKLMLKWVGIFYQIGNDTGNTNFGRDIRLAFGPVSNRTGNFAGQGITTDVILTDFTASYMFKHNYFFDLHVGYRSSTAAVAKFTSESFFIGAGVRINMNERRWDF